MTRFARPVLVAVLLVCAGGASSALGQAGGPYTAAQAERGAAVFNTSCSMCHGQDLGGGPGTPSLTGPEFMFGWKQKTAAELNTYIKTNMPPGAAGSLSDQQYVDLVAVILKANGQAPGAAELSTNALAAVHIAAP